jgi:signal transduction histidine kinase
MNSDELECEERGPRLPALPVRAPPGPVRAADHDEAPSSEKAKARLCQVRSSIKRARSFWGDAQKALPVAFPNGPQHPRRRRRPFGRRLRAVLSAAKAALRSEPGKAASHGEYARRTSNELIRSAVVAMHEGIAICNAVRSPDGRLRDFLVTYMNPRGCRDLGIVGVPEDGAPAAVLLRGLVGTGLFEKCARTLETGEPSSISSLEYAPPDADRSREPTWLDVNVSRLGDGVVVAFADVTDRTRAELQILELNQALARRSQALEASNEELAAFSSAVSHDLRAHLRALDGLSEVLAEDHAAHLDEDGRAVLHRVRLQSRRMGEIIDDLLRLARLSQSPMERRPVDLSELARDIADQLRQEDIARAAEWTIAPGLETWGDHGLLTIACENLLSNAWKYTARTAQARIEVGRIDKDGATAFFVRDNGAGFDAAAAGELFGPFRRFHQDDEFPGTGVGLATVQRIVRRHGGRLWAESERGSGATFYFTLPDQDEGLAAPA